jgi:hypothetical protein
LTEDQKAIINSFPETDRGVVNSEDKMETDPIHAAFIKMNMKKRSKQEHKSVRFEGEEASSEDEEFDYDEEIDEDNEELKEEMEYVSKK